MSFTEAQLRLLTLSDQAQNPGTGGGRPITNPISRLFHQEFGCCPQSLYVKSRRTGIKLSEPQRLQWLAWRKLHAASPDEREMLTRSVMQRLRRELARLENDHG